MAASRNPLVRLGHIRDEITDLTKALEDISFENFIGNYVLRRTAEHAILIISEAVKSLSAEFTDHYAGMIGALSEISEMFCVTIILRSIQKSYGWLSLVNYLS